MDDDACRKIVSSGYLCLASLASSEFTALFKQFRHGYAVNGAIHTSSTQQRTVGSIHNRVHPQLCDVGFDNLKTHDHIRNTPKRVSSIGALSAALSDKASTSRDLRGSMMPSSQSRAEA